MGGNNTWCKRLQARGNIAAWGKLQKTTRGCQLGGGELKPGKRGAELAEIGGRVLLPTGEGGPKGRMRGTMFAKLAPLTRASRTLSRWERAHSKTALLVSGKKYGALGARIFTGGLLRTG